jgi:ribonuclease E
MLFNATQAEELRVAIVDGQKLIDLDIESAAKEQKKSNIYKAVITRIEPSLEAAFVDYGAERHGFLPFKEISRAYFQPGAETGRSANIREALREGQELIVQVDKDERGNKGAALTTFISLAGRYLVLMPNNPRGGGVSRRVEGDERAELREIMDQLDAPQGMSLIARTAAIGRSIEELQWDLNYLLQLWKAIETAAAPQTGDDGKRRNPAPFLIYLESSLVIRAIRDYFQPDIGEVLIDTDEIFEQARHFMGSVMPGNVNRIKRYRDEVPLFSRFQIEHQIESAYSRQVDLPSGGAIVIDHTEALVAIDVNSGRSTRGADIEETAFKTNLEAAEEISRQLRLRDLGGLIIIDFIDMESQRNQREIENRLRDGLKLDHARVQTGKISRFGLMELSRQRLRPALAETSYIPCPRCSGTGHIRSTESAALHILRILEEEAMKDGSAAVRAQVPVDVATFLLNEKRADLQAVETRHKVNILLIPNIYLETPQHSITRLRHDELNQEDTEQPSYRMIESPAEEDERTSGSNGDSRTPRQEAAIKGVVIEPAPIVAEKTKKGTEKHSGLFSRIFSWFFGDEEEPAPVARPPKKQSRGGGAGTRDGRRGSRTGRRDETRDNRDARPVKEMKEPKEPKEAKEPKEPKAPRESRSAAAREDAAPRTREPRRSRSERREKEAPPAVTVSVEMTESPMPESAGKVAEEGNGGTSRRRGRRTGRRERPEKNDSVGAMVNAETVVVPLQPAPVESSSASIVVQLAVPPVPMPVPVPVLVPENAVPVPVTATVGDPQMEIPLVPAVEEAVVLPTPSVSVDVAHFSEVRTIHEVDPEPERVPVVDEPVVPVVDVTEIPASSEGAVAAVESVEPAAPLLPREPVVVDKALEGSGLVMIETRHEKVEAWQSSEAVESAPRPRRRRAVAVAVAEEPLVMVETRSPAAE